MTGIDSTDGNCLKKYIPTTLSVGLVQINRYTMHARVYPYRYPLGSTHTRNLYSRSVLP